MHNWMQVLIKEKRVYNFVNSYNFLLRLDVTKNYFIPTGLYYRYTNILKFGIGKCTRGSDGFGIPLAIYMYGGFFDIILSPGILRGGDASSVPDYFR